MSETVEQVDEIEKEGAAKEYDPVYIKELLSAVKPHFAQGVWDEMHRKARAKAGGKAAGRSRSAADSQSATAALSEPVTTPAAVEMQPPVAKDSEPEVEKQEMHPDCQKVAENCMKMKKERAEKAALEAETVEKSITASDKSKLSAEVNSKSVADLTAYNRRLSMQAAQGHLLTGFSQADMAWFHTQIMTALKAKAKAQGNESSAGAPLKWGAVKDASSDEVKTYEQVGKCSFNTVDDIRDRESEKSASAENTKKTKKVEKVEPFTGAKPIVTFVAASPGIIESLRKSALVGPTGRIFNEQYLKPLGLTRDDIAITYLVPRLLKDEQGKVREPTEAEIKAEWKPVHSTVPITVALGHTVKKTLGRTVNVTMPHPNALGTPRTDQELSRKREQLKKMLRPKLRRV
jgi:hypothetical protein